MIEKRKLTRSEFDHDIMVFDVKGAQRFGWLSNLSGEGLMLTRDAPVEINRKFLISIALPVLIKGRSTLRCRVECRWSDKNLWSGEGPNQYCAGFKITEISARDTETLELLIQHLGRAAGEASGRSASLG